MGKTESNDNNHEKKRKKKQKKQKRWKNIETIAEKKTKQNHQNRSAIFIMVGFYYFDPGVGDLYFDGFFYILYWNITVNS